MDDDRNRADQENQAEQTEKKPTQGSTQDAQGNRQNQGDQKQGDQQRERKPA